MLKKLERLKLRSCSRSCPRIIRLSRLRNKRNGGASLPKGSSNEPGSCDLNPEIETAKGLGQLEGALKSVKIPGNFSVKISRNSDWGNPASLFRWTRHSWLCWPQTVRPAVPTSSGPFRGASMRPSAPARVASRCRASVQRQTSCYDRLKCLLAREGENPHTEVPLCDVIRAN